MNASALLLVQFQNVYDQFLATPKDTRPEQMVWQPALNSNNITFLLWHVLRIWDSYLCLIDGRPELYEEGNWPRRLGFEAKGKGAGGNGVGTGFTADDVTEVKAPPDELNEYLEALWERTKYYLSTASDENLESELKVPWWPRPATIARIFAHIIAHSYMHIGEAQYVKGLVSRS